MIKFVVAAALLAVSSAAAAHREDAAINGVYDRLVKAKAQNSAEAIAAAFRPEAILISSRPGPAVTGDKLRSVIAPMASRLIADGVTVSTSYRVDHRTVLGSVAVDSGFMRTLFTAPEGAVKPQDMYNRFLVTLQKDARGEWKIIGDASLRSTQEEWDKAAIVPGLKHDS